MKTEIHPNYDVTKVTCSCGNTFETRSTKPGEMHIELCNVCHPFFTGKQKVVDSGGRVERFQRRYGKSTFTKPARPGPNPETEPLTQSEPVRVEGATEAVSEGNSNVIPGGEGRSGSQDEIRASAQRERHIDPSKTVGGQAVIEGVMMRAPTAWSVAVRQPDGGIVAKRSELTRLSERNRWAKVPFIRGIFVLGESLTLGFKALSWSAQVATEEEEKPLTGAQIGWTMAFAFAFFAGVFILLPAFAADFVSNDSDLLFSVIEGVIRLVLFVGYIWLIGRSAEIARVFEYHGAEHMSIHAYEAGEPLSIESVRRYPPEHPRCGTSFLLIVVLGSIILFTFLGQPGILFLIVSRLVGIPIIAGLAYELLRWSGTRPDGTLAAILARPGIWLQKLTTAVPAEDQIEVAISSLVVALNDEQFADIESRGDLPSTAVEVREAAQVGGL